MAVMGFREPNMARWVGVRPGHDGQQLVVLGSATNVQTTIVYTVPAGNLLLLCGIVLSAHGAAVNLSDLYVRNSADVLQYYMWEHYWPSDYGFAWAHSYYPPIEIPAGWDVVVANGIAASYVRSSINGILQPV